MRKASKFETNVEGQYTKEQHKAWRGPYSLQPIMHFSSQAIMVLEGSWISM